MIREFGAADIVYLIAAARWTVVLALTAMVGGGLLGLLVAVFRVVPVRPVNWLAIGYINLIQGTPLLGQLFVFFFGLPLFGLSVDSWTAAVVPLPEHLLHVRFELKRAPELPCKRAQTLATRS